MKLKDILAVVKPNEKVKISCIDVDGTVYEWSFFANNVPLGFWDRQVEKLRNGSQSEGICVQINN